MNEGGRWNYLFLFVLVGVVFVRLSFAVFDLQVVHGNEWANRSSNSFVREITIYPDRGAILDRKGSKLAENLPAMNLFVNIDFYKDGQGLNYEKLSPLTQRLEQILGDKWNVVEQDGKLRFQTLIEKISIGYTGAPLNSTVLIASDLDNDTVIKVRSVTETMEGIVIDNSSKRHYLGGEAFGQLLGYTTGVMQEDYTQLDYIKQGDEFNKIGRTGLERAYDKYLIGQKGSKVQEFNAQGRRVSDDERVIKDPVAGDTLHLTIDKTAQEKMYELLKVGTETYKSPGGVGIMMKIDTGEIIAMASYPSFNGNSFIGGISVDEYKKLSEAPGKPLFNKAVLGEYPPGSTFKPLLAAAALDAGKLNKNTIYLSSSSFRLVNGQEFPEYGGKSLGNINLKDAIAKSSNQYFCQVIRGWSMDDLGSYYSRFGIGEPTGIDLVGEADGLLPSARNKDALFEQGAFWLGQGWYEGDSCNAVIGQGIATVTPLQMVTWVAAIANGGDIVTPHLASSMIDADGVEENLTFDIQRKDVVSDESLATVREGMREATLRGGLAAWSQLKAPIAVKTGTAQFGALNEKGEYEHAHGWVSGFYPYTKEGDKPEYAFVFLLEDVGESFNTAHVVKDYINWFSTEFQPN